MSRAVWIVVAVLLALLFWASGGASAPVAGHGGSGSTALACVPPPAAFADVPLQSPVPATVRPFRHGDFLLTPLAGLSLEARVLSREDYTFGAEARLSPTDLALGWQRMADPSVYGPLEITQAGRWYRYAWDGRGPPIPVREIVRSSANMHMIPADENVARALGNVRPDQIVRLQGWLVEARRNDGWRWRSSLSRDDSGAGACEIVYVCAISSN